jgi:phage FluMu gp28-like protein
MTVQAANNPTVFNWRGYQKEVIDWRSHIRIRIWCRQSGKDETNAFEHVIRPIQGAPGDRSLISLTQRQADLSFEKVCRHTRAIAKVMCPESHEDFPGKIGGKAFTFTQHVLTLPTGQRIKSLPGRDVNALVGDKCHLQFTEFALFPFGGRKHWRYLTPMALQNGYDVDVTTTPRGKDTKAYELRQNKNGRYKVSVVDIYRAVEDGLVLYDEEGKPCSIADMQKIYNDPIGWGTEYLCIESDALAALIALVDIEKCTEPYEFVLLDVADNQGYDPQTQNIFAQRLKGLPGRLTVGWDVARRKDLSVLWFNEEVGKTHYLRLLVIMRRCRFDYQREGIVEQAMNTLPNLCGAGDETGLGMESNERLKNKYGELRWRPINFGSSKTALASRLQTYYQERHQVIPMSADQVQMDVQGLQKELKGDKLLVHETANTLEPDSHCDMAWANALALEAASVTMAPPKITVP